MLCRCALRQEGTALTFNFQAFFGENERRQFLAAINLFLGGNNDSNSLLLSLISQTML